ncbi:TRAM domain-containing protein [archaeon]|jgi:predicted RNA-binding protein with TRAM domain|nr:TRAM domain-containing protein [archaeon]MBT4022750.1 TRAM domain-containing protein [archaeon]MBT4273056.1 TRAM domain-containing protein [archaeon]MBT4461037.1 TRAM domain-containing protein [archaeon]MBT4858069.1 TRAM domain-containing protein [archaeon]
MNGNMTAPVSEGEELEVTIEAIGDKGDGIAKKDGFVLVIPGTELNQKVRIKITKVLRKVGFAEVAGEASASEAPEEVPTDEESNSDGLDDLPEPNDPTPESDDADLEPVEDSEDFGEELEKQ